MQQLDKNHPVAFTTSYNGRSNVLKNKVRIALPFSPSAPSQPPILKEYTAIWDTGATNTVITQTVIDECNLKPTGMTKTHGVHGEAVVPTFLVSIFLPNNVVVPSLRVSRGQLVDDSDVLIGMDIIGSGDFAVTNKDGKTVFSFRMPSVGVIDFVKQRTLQQTMSTPTDTPKVSRNAPCPCGSGKKYKRCCGQTQ